MNAPIPFSPETFAIQEGISLIEASAGTGKTHSITDLILRFIREGTATIESLLVLTFTNAAANELRLRVRACLEKGLQDSITAEDASACLRIQDALNHFEKAAIHTLHGFCQRCLHESSLECAVPPDFEILLDEKSYREQLQARVIRELQKLGNQEAYLLPYCEWMGFGPDYLRSCLQLRAAMRPWEQAPDPLKLNGQISVFRREVESMRLCWLAESGTLRASFLGENTPLKCEKGYRPENLSLSFDILDQWANGALPPLSFFEHVALFSLPSLQASLRKKAELPLGPLIQQAGKLLQEAECMLPLILHSIARCCAGQQDLLNLKQQQFRHDDLLLRLCQALARSPELTARLRARYRIGLIDEFQDTDPVQFEILTRMLVDPITGPARTPTPGPARPLILIGDPKQAIYSFRGGDIFTYLQARKLTHTTYYLATNWRSSPPVNAAVNLLLQSSPAPFRFDWIPYAPVHSAPRNEGRRLIQIHPETDKPGMDKDYHDRSGVYLKPLSKEASRTEALIIRAAADQVARWLDGSYQLADADADQLRPLRLGDIALLVPSNSKAEALRKALAQRGIQSVINGGASVFESEEAQDWWAILKAMRHPEHKGFLNAAIATALFGKRSDQLQSESFQKQQWQEIQQSFAKAHHDWTSGKLGKAMARMESRYCWTGNLARSADPLRALANHRHLCDLLLEAGENHTHNPDALLNWFGGRLSEPNPQDELELLRLERDSQAVHLLTMHKSKGLQYPLVLLPFAQEFRKERDATLPMSWHLEDGSPIVTFSPDASKGKALQAKQQEVESEYLRLYYVAITRAQYHCSILISDKTKNRHPIAQWLGADACEQEGPLPTPDATPPPPGFDHWLRERINDPGPANTGPVALQPPRQPPSTPAAEAAWSFSSLLQHHSESGHEEGAGSDERDPMLGRQEGVTTHLPPEATLHHFPRGIQPGLCLHDLLERADFSSPSTWPQLSHDTLHRFGYEADLWETPFTRLLQDLADLPLERSGQAPFTLAHVSPDRLFREGEFSLPLDFHVDAYASARQQFARWRQDQGDSLSQLPELALAQKTTRGLFKGVIDLWLEHEGQIHLIDWKSNWLGQQCSDYTAQAVLEGMQGHHYHLQYLLYACALRRHLCQVIPGWNYATHFGGIHYLFLRGTRPPAPSRGRFHAIPPESILEALDACFAP
jgi:exodeoxyribonuclease V beta subunit